MNSPGVDAPARPSTSHLNSLRPRTVWDIVDDAFDLYRGNFTRFASIAAIVLVPYALVDFFLEFHLHGPGGGNDPEWSGPFFLYLITTLPLWTLATTIQSAATAVATNEHLSGHAIDALASYRRLLPRLATLLAVTLLYAALVYGGFLLFIFPAVMVVTRYAFVAHTVVLEGRSAPGAFRRSRALSTGSTEKVLGLLALLLLLSLVLWGSVASVLELLFSVVPALQAGDAAARELREHVVKTIAQHVGAILLAPLGPLALTLLYYDLRVRREGLDLEREAEEIRYPLAPDPFGGIEAPIPRSALRGAGRSS